MFLRSDHHCRCGHCPQLRSTHHFRSEDSRARHSTYAVFLHTSLRAFAFLAVAGVMTARAACKKVAIFLTAFDLLFLPPIASTLIAVSPLGTQRARHSP